MKKKVQKVLLSSLLVLPASFMNQQVNAASSIDVVVDGVLQSYKQPPVIKGDITLVPLRGIFESLGADVTWNAAEKKVAASKDENKIELKIGLKTASKNGLPITLLRESELINGHTMVPLRFVSESLGAVVIWDAKKNQVIVTTKDTEVKDKEENKESNNSGDGVTNKNVTGLTYDQAYEKALKSSYSIRAAAADIERKEETRDKAAENLDYVPIGNGNGASDAQARSALNSTVQADIAWASSKKQLEMEQESLLYNVKSAYNAILQAKKAESIAALSLKNNEVQANLVQYKFTEGQASQFEVDQAEIAIKEAKSKLEEAKKSVNDAYEKFNSIMGLPTTERVALADEPAFAVLKDNNVDLHISRMLSDSTAVWLAEQNVKIAQLNVDLYTFNNPASLDTYEAKEIDVEKASLNVGSTKQQLEQNARSLYYNIKKLEETYAQLQANLSKAEQNLKITKARYDAGMAVGADLLPIQLSVEQIKQQMFDITAQLDTLKLAYEKPWVMQSAPAKN